MKVLEGIEKLEFVKNVHEELGLDFTDVTIEEALTHYQKIVDAVTPPIKNPIPNQISHYVSSQMNFGYKLSSFEDAPTTDESDVDFRVDDYLVEQNITQLSDDMQPYTHMFYYKQYWLVCWRGDYYFIDTQGYDYARYCTRLVGFDLG